MNGLAEGTVQMGTLPVHVETYYEKPRASYYLVTPARGKRPAGHVKVGANSVFVCLTCKKLDCLHADAVRRFVAAQPLESTGTAGTDDRDRY